MRPTRACCALLAAGAIAAGAFGCSSDQGTTGGQASTAERSQAQTSAATTETVPPPNASNTYLVELTELNGSGVSGEATVSVDGTSIRVVVDAEGLEAGEKHPMHIHGFRDQRRSRMPTEVAQVDERRSEAAVGPPMLALEPYPEVRSDGRLTFSGTFDDVQMLFPLELRALELHGVSQDGTYDFTVPVAVGLLRPVTGSGGVGAPNGPGGIGGGTGGTGGGSPGGGGTGGDAGSGTGGGTGGGSGMGPTAPGGGSSTPTSGAGGGSVPGTSLP